MPLGDGLVYNHVHFYVDSLRSLRYYKEREAEANAFSKAYTKAKRPGIEAGRKLWEQTCSNNAEAPLRDPKSFKPAGQDLVEQLIMGAGWRVVASHACEESASVVVTPEDQKGVKFVVTSTKQILDREKDSKSSGSGDIPDHFKKAHVERFFNSHSGKAGCAVLGFEVKRGGGVEAILAKYHKHHPALLLNKEAKPHVYKTAKGEVLVGEVFAYYSSKDPSKADPGTAIRFIEFKDDVSHRFLPGFESVDMKMIQYPEKNFPAYCDHWVSNVHDRKGFLSTLNDVLGFTPKVDFNAGVVAAGEAIIESTVTGNASEPMINKEQALKSHAQVYLPTNNALSEVGHVHLFLDQLGQGIQHLASRVSDVVSFVALVNERREITGHGFSFLNIPRSYYGRFDKDDLINGKVVDTKVSPALAEAVTTALVEAKLMTPAGVVDLDINPEVIAGAVKKFLAEKGGVISKEYDSAKVKEAVAQTVSRARYLNLYKLLREHFSEQTYLNIVRNKVLVDIQGNDVLFQIFTCNILQRDSNDESPFLEFIQRVCSECNGADGKPLPIRPGCGGFGIRNFLTLFLSIEVSKAMRQYEKSIETKDVKGEEIASKRVKILTAQLEESNPVLTAISDAMTAEADARALMETCTNEEERSKHAKEAEGWKAKKLKGNQLLQEISDRYKQKMREVREEEEKASKSG